MNNPIIAEIRRIRDEHARKHNYNFDAIMNDWMKIEPWMKRRTVTLRGGKIVPAYPVRKTKKTRRG